VPSQPALSFAHAAVTHDLVAAFERSLHGRVRAYYLEGSSADETMLETSDLDLVVVFKDRCSAAEREQAAGLLASCDRISALELDVTVTDEATLGTGASPQLKLGARLVYGDDIRDRVRLIPIGTWARDRMHTSYWRTIKLFERPNSRTLAYRLPRCSRRVLRLCSAITRLPDGSSDLGTRDLVRSIGWISMALVARRAGQYVVRKRDCHCAYRTYVGGQWAALVEETYTLCRASWRYRIPEAAIDRAGCGRSVNRSSALRTRFSRATARDRGASRPI
jgi:hypothetical protein